MYVELCILCTASCTVPARYGLYRASAPASAGEVFFFRFFNASEKVGLLTFVSCYKSAAPLVLAWNRKAPEAAKSRRIVVSGGCSDLGVFLCVCNAKDFAFPHRALSELSSELSRSSRTVHATCLNLSSRLRLLEGGASAAVEKQALLTAQLEEQLKDKVRDVIQLQVRCDTEKADLTSRWAWGGLPGREPASAAALCFRAEGPGPGAQLLPTPQDRLGNSPPASGSTKLFRVWSA